MASQETLESVSASYESVTHLPPPPSVNSPSPSCLVSFRPSAGDCAMCTIPPKIPTVKSSSRSAARTDVRRTWLNSLDTIFNQLTVKPQEAIVVKLHCNQETG
eukprot:gb/GECG01008108.1/.p1 GENE.gb/GECG01008108.1/~~gb/GECG01008108.1/.p1  ORF type:complete len:103 (+),score=6.27 gb/GECG01008108.1/:1-309(+)